MTERYGDDLTRQLHATTDAHVWARRFMETQRDASAEGRSIIDEGTMIGWFANAIEVGRAHGRNPALTVEDLRKKAWQLVQAKADGHLVSPGVAELIDELADTLQRTAGWNP